jgi:hypothetical protein
MAIAEEQKTTTTVRLELSFHRRLKARLAADGTNFQAKVEELLREYVDGPVEQRDDIARQVAIAREGMQRYAAAMRELAR